ncbi:MAG TPA: pyridoxal phosphate-dependent aminotransferase [Blastocatellia bacterium]|nr:pyridoxal phosphate-dependent aminotransferase [Blastocatellia bacterium]
MFSNRFKWNLATNRLAQLIEEKKRSGVKLLDLTESNPTRVGLHYPFALSALAEPQVLQYDPHPRGLTSTREAVAAYYQTRQQTIDPDRIFLTASTSEAYSWLFKLLCDPGDAILVPQPSYPLFEFLATLEGIVLQPYHLDYVHPRGWRLDMDSLLSAISPNTRAVIVVNPNNPTGSYLKRNELAQLEEICRQHNLALIVDEVFSDYALVEDAERMTSFADTDVLTFVLNGLSKLLALPQMKLGWIVTHGADEVRQSAETRLELIADTFLSVNTPVQWAARQWLSARAELHQQIGARTQANLSFLAEATQGSACRLLQVEGGWNATLEVPRQASEEELVLTLLEETNVLVHPGYFFEFAREAFFVLSLLPKAENFHPAVRRIVAAF